MHPTRPRPVGQAHPHPTAVERIGVDEHRARPQTTMRDMVAVRVGDGFGDLSENLQLLLGDRRSGGQHQVGSAG